MSWLSAGRVARWHELDEMTGDHDTSFGDLLRTYRLTAGLSQAQLAEQAGLSTDAVSALEQGI